MKQVFITETEGNTVKPEGFRAVVSECSEGATRGLRVSTDGSSRGDREIAI